jgi:hypothetical protein
MNNITVELKMTAINTLFGIIRFELIDCFQQGKKSEKIKKTLDRFNIEFYNKVVIG